MSHRSSRVRLPSQATVTDGLDFSAILIASPNTPFSVSQQRQILRQFRQIVSKQLKQRQVLFAEEQAAFDDLQQMKEVEEMAMSSFQNFRENCDREAKKQQHYATLWNDWATIEHLNELVRQEAEQRDVIHMREWRMRATLQALRKVDEEPLLWTHAFHMVIFAEKVRRVAFYRSEFSAATSLNIPGYNPIFMSVEGISDNKSEWMRSVRCPFHWAEDCPFFPDRLLHSLKCVLEECQPISAAASSPRPSPFPVALRSAAGRLPAVPKLPRGVHTALRSALSQEHYRRSHCCFLPHLGGPETRREVV